MYDYAMFEASRMRYNDIQRKIEKSRQGMEIHGVAPQADRVLPAWVNQLLHASPFRRHEEDAQVDARPRAN